MRCIARIGAGALLVLSGQANPVALRGQSSAGVEAILKASEEAYRSLRSYRADFRQTITNPMLGGPEHSRGILFLSPPNQFAMRFTDPAGERIVADGTWLWLYAPSTTPGQVIRQPVPRTGAVTPNFFSQFLERPLERYTASLMGVDTVAGQVTDVVKLIPRTPDLPFREALIAIGRSDSLPRRLALLEESGQRRVIVLEKPALNRAIPAAELRFTPPKDVRVVTP